MSRGTQSGLPEGISSEAWSHPIPDFQVEDYQCILSNMTGLDTSKFDFKTIHRFAPNMTCWPLHQASRWLSANSDSTTDQLLEFIQSQGMSSNVDTEEVQDVSISNFEIYMLGAINALVKSHEAYVAAVQRTFAVNADRPRWFNVHPELFESGTRSSS